MARITYYIFFLRKANYIAFYKSSIDNANYLFLSLSLSLRKVNSVEGIGICLMHYDMDKGCANGHGVKK